MPSGGSKGSDGSERRALDRSLIQGIAWTSVVKWGAQVLTWGSTAVVARLLTPEDYGLVAMAAVYFGLVAMLSEFGLGTAIVTLRELSGKQVAQLNGLSLVLGVVGFFLSLLAALPLGWFFDAPRLPTVVVVMSVTFLITAFSVVPRALLQKELRFKRLAVVEGAQASTAALGTVAFAVAGFGYWSLVFGRILDAAASTALLLYSRRHGFRLPRLGSLNHALRFSSHIITGRIAWYGYSNADYIFAGRILGQSALGAYQMAWSLGHMPAQKIASMILRVTPAYFSAVQDDVEELRRYFLLLTEGIATIAFPATIGIALVADDLILLAIGDQWTAAIGPLRILAAYASFRSIKPLLAQVLNVTGESGFAMRNSLLAVTFLPLGFWFGSQWGVVGIAAAWLFIHPLVSVPLYVRTFRMADTSARDYLGSLWPALSGCAIMAAAVLLVRQGLAPDLSRALRLLVQVAAGMVTYAAVLLIFHRDRVRVLRRVATMLKS